MNNRPLNEYNARPVLERLEQMIESGCSRPIRMVYDDLSIFDWWPERLTISHMKQMRTFLKEAIKLGYTGYVCFKVGASGCANGMWASKAESTNGYSPKGETLYRSFTPDYTYYGFCDKDEVWYPGGDQYDSLKTTKQLENALQNYQEAN
jgi:hypothetical protein